MLWLICCSSQFLLLWLCLEFVCFPSYDLTSWQVRCTVYFPLPRLVWKSKCPLNQNLSTQKACESCRLPVVPKSHEGLKSRGGFFFCIMSHHSRKCFWCPLFLFCFSPLSGPVTHQDFAQELRHLEEKEMKLDQLIESCTLQIYQLFENQQDQRYPFSSVSCSPMQIALIPPQLWLTV